MSKLSEELEHFNPGYDWDDTDIADQQRVIARARELEAEVERLRAENAKLRAFNLPSDHAMRTAHKMHAEVTAQLDAYRVETERLREERERAESDAYCKGYEDCWGSDGVRLSTELDAYRAAVAKLRTEAEARIDFEDAWGLQERLLSILDRLPK